MRFRSEIFGAICSPARNRPNARGMEEGLRKGDSKENSCLIRTGETFEFQREDTMPIVRVPDVVVRELVDIRLRLAIAVDVHVGHGTCRMSHLLHRCILFGGIKPFQLTQPTFMFFVLKKNSLFSKSVKYRPRELSN